MHQRRINDLKALQRNPLPPQFALLQELALSHIFWPDLVLQDLQAMWIVAAPTLELPDSAVDNKPWIELAVRNPFAWRSLARKTSRSNKQSTFMHSMS